MEPLRVLELYAGIGGMHWSAVGSGAPVRVVAAVEVTQRLDSSADGPIEALPGCEYVSLTYREVSGTTW